MGASERNSGCVKVTVFNVKYFRYVCSFLSLIEMLLSFLFYKIGGFYFFMEETFEVVPVSSLASQGGGEDLLIGTGAVLFAILCVFNFLRLRRKVGTADFVVLFLILTVQATFLVVIEVASLSISIAQEHGWILLAWFVVYASLWILFLFSIFQSGRSNTAN